jgi:hypothetical protein
MLLFDIVSKKAMYFDAFIFEILLISTKYLLFINNKYLYLRYVLNKKSL